MTPSQATDLDCRHWAEILQTGWLTTRVTLCIMYKVCISNTRPLHTVSNRAVSKLKWTRQTWRVVERDNNDSTSLEFSSISSLEVTWSAQTERGYDFNKGLSVAGYSDGRV